MLESRVILPTPEFFPDPYSKDPASAEMMFKQVCGYMRVDRGPVRFEIFADETEELRSMLPYWGGNSGGCAGFFSHAGKQATKDGDDGRMLVAVRGTHLADPLGVNPFVETNEIGTLAVFVS
jgi:hypothetical protein